MEDATPTITVDSHSSAARFLERMEPLLLAKEAQYGLMLGIALTVLNQPNFYTRSDPYFAVVEDEEGVAAAGCMTPPYGIILYCERDDSRLALTALARALLKDGWKLPTANGPEPICTDFAQIWSDLAGVRSEVAVRERTFELREVIHPAYSPGHMRQATMDDLDLLVQWHLDFVAEAMHETEKPDIEETRHRLTIRVQQGMLYVWEDGGEIVCWVGTTRPTVHGITIGPVYTPPRFRGKGYASSCVAAVSQKMLDSGRAFCTLFTDLANPTSNSIYQKIGYRPICDYTVYKFEN